MTLPNYTITQNETGYRNPKILIVQDWLRTHLAEQLSLDKNAVEITEQLSRYGLDSIDAVTLVGDLEDYLELELPSTLFWEHPTIAQAATYLVENYDFAEDSLRE